MSTTELSMKMSLSPTNCRTMPEASVLSMTFGTPSGSTFIAAVPIVVPADPPRASTPESFSARVGLSREPCRAFRGLRHRLAAVGMLTDHIDRRPGQLEDLFARDVGRNRRCAERADVDEGHRDVPRGEKIAHEGGLAPFRVERGKEKDGGHGEAHYIQ